MQLPIEVRFVRLLAMRLHEYGTAAHRLEDAVSGVAERLKLSCEVFSTPTSVFLSFRDVSDPLGQNQAYPVQLLRLRPGSMDTDKLCAVDAIAEDVASGELTLDEGAVRLLDVPNRPPVAPLWVQLTSWATVGGSVAALLGSRWIDIGVSALLATLTGLFALRIGRRWQEAGSFEPIVAFVITIGAYLATMIGAQAVPSIVIAALIILMPGLDLTIAITELSTGHLASGTNRFAGATVVVIKLALGVMLATQVMTGLSLTETISVVDLPGPPPGWFLWIVLMASGFAFGVLFNTNSRDWPAVLLAAMLAYTVNRYAGAAFGTEFGVFIAAMLIAAMSNVYARLFQRPAAIMRMPGLILLVPGSLAYRALTLMFSHNIADGIDAAVSMAIVLAALVGGQLMGNTLVQPRRAL